MLGSVGAARRYDGPRPHGGPYDAGMTGTFLVRVTALSERPGLAGLQESARDRVLGTLFGDQQPAGEVDGYAGPADEGEYGKDDPDCGDIRAQVAGDAGGDPRDHPVVDRAVELLRGVVCGLRTGSGCVHASSLVPRARYGYREGPPGDPEVPPGGIRDCPDSRLGACGAMMVGWRS